MRLKVLVLFSTCLFMAFVAQGQRGPDDDPDSTPGYVNNAFHHGEIDSINLYSGQLTVPIALGPSYPIGPKLRFGLSLTYNSRIRENGRPDTISRGQNVSYHPLVGDPALGIGWMLTTGAIKQCPFGTGFSPCYVGPDGSPHIFSIETSPGSGFLRTQNASQFLLHGLGASGYEMWDGDGNKYTFGTTGFVGGFDDVNAITGNIFDYVRDFGWSRNGWYLTGLADPYGNSMSVSYRTAIPPCWAYGTCGSLELGGAMNCPGASTRLWVPDTITMPTASLTVNWDSTNRRVSGVTVKVVGNTSKTWTIEYGTQLITKNCNVTLRTISAIDLPSDVTGSPKYTFAYAPADCAGEALLDSAKTPAGATFDYYWQYYTFFHGRASSSFCDNIYPPYTDVVVAIAADTVDSCSHNSAGPTPTAPHDPCMQGDPITYEDIEPGLSRRRQTIPGMPGSTIVADTTYTQYSFPFGEKGTSQASCGTHNQCSQTLTVVLEPPNADGVKMAKGYLFWSSPMSNVGAKTGDRTSANTEERVYNGNPNVAAGVVTLAMPACSSTGPSSNSICSDSSFVARVTQRTFEYDTMATETTNRRTVSETVCHGALTPAGACATSKTHAVGYSLSAGTWESNGRHYTTEQQSGTLGNDNRKTETTWGPSNWATQTVDMSGNLVGNVLPNRYTHRTDCEYASWPTCDASKITVDRYVDIDPVTGFLSGTVTLDASKSRILGACRYPDPSHPGDVQNEFTATAEPYTSSNLNGWAPHVCSPGTGSPWAIMPTAGMGNNDAFGKHHVHQNGLRVQTNWLSSSLGVNNTIGWLSFDVDRDTTTGWIGTARDSAGVSTGFAYDSIGRVTSIAPTGETATVVTYDAPGPTQILQTTAARSGGANLTTYQRYMYDGLGRLLREVRQTSGSSYAVQVHAYDGAGHEKFTSVWTACTNVNFNGDCQTVAPAGTTSSLFDPFGRPQKIVGPFNATYTGVDRTDGGIPYSDTKETVTSCVNGTWSGTSCVNIAKVAGLSPPVIASLPQTVTFRDAFGRVTSVIEKTSAADPGDTTSYTYDVNDKLKQVNQSGLLRTFVYDPFGFLRSETTPEKGVVDTNGIAGDGKIGSLGNLRRSIEGFGTANPKTHDMVVDAAGRLLTEYVNGVLFTANCYDGSLVSASCPDGKANVTGGLMPKGKLTRTVGGNPLFVALFPTTPASPVSLEETFDYSDVVGGRLSVKTSRFLTGANDGIQESWIYNTLGLVSSHSHPRILNKAASNFAELKEATTYSYGLPSAVVVTGRDYDNSIVTPSVTVTAAYQPSGALSSYTTTPAMGLAVTTTITQDSSGLPRPARISSSSGGFDTGIYTYDASGNISVQDRDASNVDIFAYDSRSRITAASYKVTGTTSVQTDAYDKWGNLLNISGVGARPVFCTGSCTNNKLPPAIATYDERGNLLAYGVDVLSFDDTNRQTKNVNSGGGTWQYLYDSAGERLIRAPSASSGFSVTRREMARYSMQAAVQSGQSGWGMTVTACNEASLTFLDVHCADGDWGNIQTIFEHSVVAGCGGGNYCPETPVTRAQMAVFLIATHDPSPYVPPACVTPVFSDVPCSNGFAKWVNELSARGVTTGCGGGLYCPNTNITEQQMVVFLSAMKGPSGSPNPLWSVYHPVHGGSTYTLRDTGNRAVTELADSFPSKDNVWLGGILVATYLPKSPTLTTPKWLFHSSDHLGTVRQTYNLWAGTYESHKYWPYGDEFSVVLAGQRIAFAAMERDTEASHFYDHARTHDFNLGRFLGPDTLRGKPADPQGWNRYTYALNSPLNNVDPDGQQVAAVNAGKIALHEQRLVQTGQMKASVARSHEKARLVGAAAGLVAISFLALTVEEIAIVGSSAAPVEQKIAEQANKLGSMTSNEIVKSLGSGQSDLLRKFFGSGLSGTQARLANFEVPEGMTRETLLKYQEIAERAIGAGLDESGVQAQRLQLIRKALEKVSE